MTWVRTLGEEQATGALKARYNADLHNFGFVLQSTKALSARPELTLAYDTFKNAVWAKDGLSVRERRLINLVVADRGRSTYCALVYAAALGRDFSSEEIRAILADYQTAGLTEREVAILEYAEAIPAGHVHEEHVGRLRQVGLDDASIVDVAVTAAFRLFGCRVYGALGVEPDAFFLEEEDLVAAIRRPTAHDPAGRS